MTAVDIPRLHRRGNRGRRGKKRELCDYCALAFRTPQALAKHKEQMHDRPDRNR